MKAGIFCIVISVSGEGFFSIFEQPLYVPWSNVLILMVVIIALLIILTRFRTNQIRKVEKEKATISAKIADLELQALQAQMNPHFIFNAINAIQAYILDNKVDEALLYLSDFARIVRASLENVNRRTITLEEELDFVNSYLNLEKMRFPDKVRWQINLNPEVDPKQIIIPPMIMQPYIENAIRHGIRHKKEGGLLLIKIEILEDNRLHYILEDNGIGRLKSSVLNFRFKLGDTRNEHSTLITEKRIQLLNPKENQHLYYVKITDLDDEIGKGTGTRVDIFLPLVRA
jgi:LytS/YehU family sensor histidine kinase